MKKATNRYKPIPKHYSVRLTLYGKICEALKTGDYKKYEKILSPLENCRDTSELKDIITNLMRDYLLQFKREKYLPTNMEKAHQLFKR